MLVLAYDDELGRDAALVAEVVGDHYSAEVLNAGYGVDLESVDAPWVVRWTDGINDWREAYELPWHALARLAAVVAAVEQDVFLVHDATNRGQRDAVVDEVDRYVSRTVHASSCAPGCAGRDPVYHRV